MINNDLDSWILHVDVRLMRGCTGAKGSDLNFSHLQLFHKGKAYLNSSIHMGLLFGGEKGIRAGEETHQKFPH